MKDHVAREDEAWRKLWETWLAATHNDGVELTVWQAQLLNDFMARNPDGSYRMRLKLDRNQSYYFMGRPLELVDNEEDSTIGKMDG